MNNCPDCGAAVIYVKGHWHCTNKECGVSW